MGKNIIKNDFRIWNKILYILKFGVKLFLIYTSIVIFLLLFFRFVLPQASAFIYSDSDDPIFGLFVPDKIIHKSVPISKISRNAVLAVVASEDQMFFEHFGFDFEQIEKAMKENERRKRIRGASTITMQVAKNLFLWPGKNLIRKGFEAYYTILLELVWSKKRIVEVYLNVAEMGKDIYGISSASKIYFNKTPARLSTSECALLAAVLPNPKKRNPKRPSGYLIGRKAKIIDQMNMLGGIRFLSPYLD